MIIIRDASSLFIVMNSLSSSTPIALILPHLWQNNG